MISQHISDHGLLLLGCGKMGSALLAGWLANGLPSKSIWVQDPHPSDWVKAQNINLNTDLPTAPAVVILAVKPQMMQDAVPASQSFGGGSTVFLSIAAGVTIGAMQNILPAQTPIIRAMPNTPAAVGHGITALIGNAHLHDDDMARAEGLLSAVGQTVRLDTEAQMDAVTGVSGSGPAYVFHLIETLAAAGAQQGLPADLALKLAKATVAGAGILAQSAEESPSELRVNVTSPYGTTAAALEILMDGDAGFPPLMNRAVAAATNRSKELANG